MTGWRLLAVLFAARATMAFQFQAVAALAPSLMERHGVGLAEIGLLIGLYLSPGLVAAYPGGAIGRRFGERRVVLAGLCLMLAGGLLTVLAPGWEAQLAGRVVAGTGGILLNMLMTKLVTDAFAGGRLATAMSIFVNSWPLGIGSALLVLPPVAEGAGLDAALWLVAALVLLGLLIFAFGTRPAAEGATQPLTAERLRAAPLTGAVLTGAIWGLYNGGLAMVFGFGPALLAERGWGSVAAGQMTSAVLWLMTLSIPLGGVLADRTGRRDAVLAAGLLGFAVFMALGAVPCLPGAALIGLFLILGLFGGIPAGPIMSLPAGVLPPPVRAEGMGVFFTLFYLGTMGAPLAAGWLSEVSGTSAAAFVFGAVLLLLCLPALTMTARIARGLHSA
ncbi:MAG: MFS transporter [Pseudomonadota bacterium]